MTSSFVRAILFEGWISTKAAWGQSARPHYPPSSEMARLHLKRTDTSRVRVGKPLGTILPTGTDQLTRLNQFWQCHLAYSGILWTRLNKGVIMGSPISSTIAKIFLQHYENLLIKHWTESNFVTYYSRYVDDIFIIFNTKNTTENIILNNRNKISKHIEFKMTTEENNTINYPDITITRYTEWLEIDIFHKSTATSTTIHAQSKHTK
jgi:hypothetical protein